MQRAEAPRLARRHAPPPSTAAPAAATAPATAPPPDAAPPAASSASSASSAGRGAASPEAGEPTRAPDKARGGSKQVISLDEFLVEGKLEKPSAYYILRRSSADHDWARLDARFLPLVLESVQDPLF
jgi:hypothetical protein